MLRIRTISNRLASIQVDTLIPLFAIMGLRNERFGGIISRLTSGDPFVVSADLHVIERLMDTKTLCGGTCGVTDGAPPIPDRANCTQQRASPPPQDDVPPPPRGNPHDYSPSKGVR